MVHSLISIDKALALITAQAAPVGRTEAVQAGSAAGRILARPVRSRSMAPAFDNAAMDGYAIATSALTGASPWVLPVVARVPAGQAATASVAGGGAARIITGAPIPGGANSDPRHWQDSMPTAARSSVLRAPRIRPVSDCFPWRTGSCSYPPLPRTCQPVRSSNSDLSANPEGARI